MQPIPPNDATNPGPATGTPEPERPLPVETPPVYRPAEFWDDRLRHHFDLMGVGYSRLGKPFNVALYRQRLVVLGRTTRRFRIRPKGADVVELGPGTGFYVDYWRTCQIGSLLGLDIAAVAAERLAAQFPEYRFIAADITEHWPAADASADIVTAFDVLFHITDDDRFEAALREAGRVLRPGGILLVSDLFLHRTPFRAFHQVSRTLSQYEATLAAAGFDILGRMPIFVAMHPALDLPDGRRKRLATNWWSWLEQRLVDEPKRGFRLGRVLGWIDRGLTKVSWGGPSTELLVARRRTR